MEAATNTKSKGRGQKKKKKKKVHFIVVILCICEAITKSKGESLTHGNAPSKDTERRAPRELGEVVF